MAATNLGYVEGQRPETSPSRWTPDLFTIILSVITRAVVRSKDR